MAQPLSIFLFMFVHFLIAKESCFHTKLPGLRAGDQRALRPDSGASFWLVDGWGQQLQASGLNTIW